MSTRLSALPAVLLLAGTVAQAQVVQERVDLSMIQRIRAEGLNNSKIEELAGHLNDVIGPRLTGSTGMKNANQWTAQQFTQWGLQNVSVEPWGEFGRGWDRISFAGRILTPFPQPLDAQPMAWTGSTRGTVTGPAVIFAVNSREDLEKYRGKLKNAWLLQGQPPMPGPEYNQRERRFSLDSLFKPLPPPPENRTMAQPPAAQRPGGGPGQQQAPAISSATIDSLIRAEGAAGFLRPSPWQYTLLRVGGGGSRVPTDPIALPALTVSIEQYGQLYRNVQRGIPVSLEINVQNRFLTEDTRAYNTLADLPGTDKADEYVMLGAHLDSWHTGTGATDNSAGSVIMMEAMRILKTLGVQPRRTIRIALWSGEEQGLLGSRNWVNNHKELHPRISAYVNVDNGTGRLRGIWTQSNPFVQPIFEQIFAPLRDLGVMTVRHGDTGGTDHQAFDAVNIPGFNFIQDPIEYSIRTHHSNADTYDHLVIDDLKQAAVVVATTVYHLAMRDQMMPRKQARPASN